LDWFDHPRRQRTVKIKGTPVSIPGVGIMGASAIAATVADPSVRGNLGETSAMRPQPATSTHAGL
jgi:hypothetical protein